MKEIWIIDKLKTIPIDLSKFIHAVKKYVVKNTVFERQ